jgi:hypothetical protein
MLVGHAPSIEGCTRQLLGNSPRPYEFIRITRNTPFLSTVICERDNMGLFNLKLAPTFKHLGVDDYDWRMIDVNYEQNLAQIISLKETTTPLTNNKRKPHFNKEKTNVQSKPNRPVSTLTTTIVNRHDSIYPLNYSSDNIKHLRSNNSNNINRPQYYYKKSPKL